MFELIIVIKFGGEGSLYWFSTVFVFKVKQLNKVPCYTKLFSQKASEKVFILLEHIDNSVDIKQSVDRLEHKSSWIDRMIGVGCCACTYDVWFCVYAIHQRLYGAFPLLPTVCHC